jgi:hypothetical protein
MTSEERYQDLVDELLLADGDDGVEPPGGAAAR